MKAVVLMGLAVLLGTAPAEAGEAWPERPIHVVVPFGGGSLADLVPRIVFDRVSQRIGKTIVIDNRPGAVGTIGAAFVAASNPDGYVFLVNSNAQVNAPLLYANLPYNAEQDFSPVALLVTYPDALIISPSKHITTLGQFVRVAKARKDGLTFAAFGTGSAAYMTAERFRLRAGYDAVQVPFKSAPAAIREVMEGRVDFCFCGVGTSLPFIRAGKIVALAVSARTRSPLLPDVPTTLEAGFPESEYTPWLGLFAPARTPRDVVAHLHDEIAAALEDSEVRDKLIAIGTEPAPMSGAEFDSFLERDRGLNASLVMELGLKPR